MQGNNLYGNLSTILQFTLLCVKVIIPSKLNLIRVILILVAKGEFYLTDFKYFYLYLNYFNFITLLIQSN